MSSPKDKLEPIMTNSENIVQFFPNAYFKPAAALNILTGNVMGRELIRLCFQRILPSLGFQTSDTCGLF